MSRTLFDFEDVVDRVVDRRPPARPDGRPASARAAGRPRWSGCHTRGRGPQAGARGERRPPAADGVRPEEPATERRARRTSRFRWPRGARRDAAAVDRHSAEVPIACADSRARVCAGSQRRPRDLHGVAIGSECPGDAQRRGSRAPPGCRRGRPARSARARAVPAARRRHHGRPVSRPYSARRITAWLSQL